MWAIIFWVALGVIGLATVSLLILFIRRGGPAAPTAGGSSNKINLVKWFFIVLFGWLLYSIGSCIFMLPRTYSRTAQKIAQEGREWKEALAEIARKATSPADTQQKLPKEEPEEASSPLSRVEMVDWWIEHGRPKSADGWKEVGPEVDFHSAGELGLEPVINTAFWEGYQLKVQPTFGFDLGLKSVALVDSRVSNADEAVLLRLGYSLPDCYTALINRETGLLWLHTWLPYEPTPSTRRPLEFTASIVEPKDNPYLVRRKQGSVRFAYQREFRPAPGKGEMSRCCRLPFEIEVLSGPVQVDFDLDVTLTPLPKPGKTTVDKTRPNQRDLDERVVVLMLAADDNRAVVFPERQVNEWHVRLRSEDMRQTWSNPHQHKHGTLWLKCLIPVGVHVAAQIGGSRR